MSQSGPVDMTEAEAEAIVNAVLDRRFNSYETTREPGVVVEGAATSVTGANGRRILIRDDADGVYIGGVLITSRDDLAVLVSVLGELSHRRLA